MYDPMDHDVIAKYNDICLKATVLPSKSFIMSHDDLAEFHRPGKSVLHTRFFDFVKRKLGVLVDQPSTDKDNQRPFPKGAFVPPPTARYHSDHHKYAVDYVESLWPGNPGTYDGLTLWPTTDKQALAHLKRFLKERFQNFGTYQDAIHPDHPFLYHSTISPALNIGLLTPHQVLHEVLAYVIKHNVPMNSLEGFVRQLIGWREYMRYLYVFHHTSYMTYPLPRAKAKRIKDWKAWHTGTTPFPIVNAEIKKCMSASGGYAHHIIRLMVFLNVFLLLRIHPEDICRWFMEVCAIDAYDWVMKPNIYCMGYFYPKAMSRQYISTSNYVVKMSSSQYKRDPVWDALFHKYITDFRPPVYMRNMR
jgi:deoxyribodipyrimidine photolyase-related protein